MLGVGEQFPAYTLDATVSTEQAKDRMARNSLPRHRRYARARFGACATTSAIVEAILAKAQFRLARTASAVSNHAGRLILTEPCLDSGNAAREQVPYVVVPVLPRDLAG